MKMPPTTWTPIEETGLTLDDILAHPEIEWLPALGKVRWVPTPKSDKIVWKKISKSDQP